MNELLIKASTEFILDGKECSPRGLKTLELEDVFLELENPKANIVTLPERKLDLKYLEAELKWYDSGDLSIEKIKDYSSMWSKIANHDLTANSNYGYFVNKQLINGKSQFDWCVSCFDNDINTRQALINYNQPHHKYDGNKDFVCTISQSFRFNKGLDSTVLMRSNDLIYGFCYDVPWFTLVQKELANKLNLPIGVYKHYASSLHVYEQHFGMLAHIFNNYNLNSHGGQKNGTTKPNR